MFGCGSMLKKKSSALGSHKLRDLAILEKFNIVSTCLGHVSFIRGLSTTASKHKDKSPLDVLSNFLSTIPFSIRQLNSQIQFVPAL